MTDALKEAQRLYQEALDASRDQRSQIDEDLRFSDPSDPQQWDEDVKRQREQDPGGKRPCLVLDQTGQYVSNVSGQIEQQPPSLHAIPETGGAEKQAAEQLDGRFRQIEYASRASQHYARALTSAARTGVGYLIARPEYIDRALGYQAPRISSEPDPLKVVFDPWSTETDGSDATFGYLLTSFSPREFERKWPGKELADFGDPEQSHRNDSRKSVLIAEQWYRDEVTRNVIVYIDEAGQEVAGTEEEYWAACQAAGVQLPYDRTYKDKKAVVKWRRMSGCDVLEDGEYPADFIGIVPVYGYVSFVDGRMKYCGIPRRARAAQQAYNYHKSELLMPGAQLMASKRALAGVETIWDRAQVQRRAFLPYNDMDEMGAVSSPTLIKTGSSLIDHMAGAEAALRDIQASVGIYQANLGAPSNETSGVAIESRKQQGEASNAHFPSHLSASLAHLGRIVMDMDARLADTRRQMPIMGVDGSAGQISVDPEQAKAFSRTPDGVTINPRVGKYGVRVVTGASYSTQRTQTNAAFAEIMRGNKELAPVVAPFWAQTLDFPGSDKFAQAMASMAPPAVKAILTPEGGDKGPDPAALAQQLKQCQDALQEAIQHAREAQDDADEAMSAAAEAKRSAAAKERELDIKAYQAETDRLKVTGANVDQIEAITRDLINQMLMQPDPLPGDPVTPDDSMAHEQAETPQFEQQEGEQERNSMGEAPEFEQSEAPSEQPNEMPFAGEGEQQ